MPKPPPSKALPFLGVAPDSAIAEFFEVDRRTVARWRAERGLGVSPTRLSLPPAVQSRLGVDSDSSIALSLGLHRSTPVIRRWREQLGIPAGVRGGKGKRRKTDAERDQEINSKHPGLLAKLGEVPDRELARQFGLSPSAVRKARSIRGIAPRRKKS